MFFLLSPALLVCLHGIGCVLLPGMALRHRMAILLGSPSRGGRFLVESLALGSVWSTLQFLSLYHSASVFRFSVTGLLFIKYASDLAVVILCVGWRRTAVEEFGARCLTAWRVLLRPLNLTGLLVASAFGLYAAVQFPWAADNVALYWLAAAVADVHTSIKECQGSPAYIAWLYWPSLLTWPSLNPAVMGACAKIPLNVIAFFAMKRLCGLWPATAKGWTPLWLYVLVLSTFLGDYGLLNTGKETVFGILFLFAAMAAIIGTEPVTCETEFALQCGALLALAFGFGAITIPYALVFLILAVAMNGRSGLGSGFMLRTGVFCAVPVVFSMSTMLRLPLFLCGLLFGALLVAVRLMRRRIDAAVAWLAVVANRRRTLIATVTVAGSMAAVWLLLPVRYLKRELPPLDGVTGFVQVFLTPENTITPVYVNAMAFAGFLLVLAAPARMGGRHGLAALIAFPFAALVPTLLLAHAPGLPIPFHPQHLWDLAKDVPNWCWGIISHFFAIIALSSLAGLLAEQLAGLWPRLCQHRFRIAGGLTALLVCGHFGKLAANGKLGSLLRWDRGAWLTPSGGGREPETALFGQAIMQHLASREQALPERTLGALLVDRYSALADRSGEFRACGLRRPRQAPDLLEGGQAFARAPAEGLLIANRKKLKSWHDSWNRDLVFQEIENCGGEDSLFSLRRGADGTASLVLKESPPFAPVPPSFLDSLLRRPLLIWDAVAATPVRNRDGHRYLWGRESGTMWVSWSRSAPKHPSVRIRAKFIGEPAATLTIESPLFAEPAVLSRERRSIEVNPAESCFAKASNYYGMQWFPLHFLYRGPLLYHETLGYLKSYRIESLAIFGNTYLE